MAKQYDPIDIFKNRTNIVTVALGIDVSLDDDTPTSEIRTEKDVGSTKIAEWDVSFATDGTDGELVLTLDNSVTEDIVQTTGFMDIKRVVNGEPINAFANPIPVVFKGTVTE
jgi:hypothetical protein